MHILMPCSWCMCVPGISRLSFSQKMFIQAGLRRWLASIVVGTKAEFEETHMIGSEFNPDFDHLKT